MKDNFEIPNECLECEDVQQKPAKAIITFIVSLVVIVLLFSLLLNEILGSGGEAEIGEGAGKGTEIGSGSGSGEGVGHGVGKGSGVGYGIAESNTDASGQGDEGRTDAKEAEAKGRLIEPQTNVSNVTIALTEPRENKEIKEKFELPTKTDWSPSAFKIGAKKGSGRQNHPSEAVGRGGGGGTKTMGTGDVSFRIYWKPAIHDIDLHVLDPNGHHLWFSNNHCGCAGQLDVDDTQTGGPENIFWPKDKAPEGEYVYWVKYYQGAKPKNITIEIRRAGKLTKTRKVRLRKMGDESKRFYLIHD